MGIPERATGGSPALEQVLGYLNFSSGAPDPQFLANLEKLIAAHPNGAQRIQIMKERFNAMAAQRAR